VIRRKWRLRHRDDFQRLRNDGVPHRHRSLLLSISPNQFGHNRYGFIVSKQLGNAVVRNRIRRQLRDIVRRRHPALKTGFDMVFIARSGIAEQPFAQIERIVLDLTRRAEL